MQLTFKHIHLFCFLSLFFFSAKASHAQTTEKEAMAKLSFLMGNWKGESNAYLPDGNKKTIEVVARVQYEMDGNLLVLNVKSSSLQLHTVINYDLKGQQYFYTPFTKKGGNKYRGEYVDGRFLVWFSDTRRLTFERTEAGLFHEYGENLKDGKWSKYFEDLLYPSSEN